MKKSDVIEAIKCMDILLGESDVLVVGSQSLHGAHPDVPDEILYSREVDVVLGTKARLGNWLADVVGAGTPFDIERGYYIDHVYLKDDFPILAKGWRDRVVKETIDGKIAVSYLSPEDLVIAKLAAGREKDITFVAGMVSRKLVDLERVSLLVETLDEKTGSEIISRLEAMHPNTRIPGGPK